MVLCNNLEGWEWAGGVRKIQERGHHVHLWLIHVDVQKESNQCYKPIINQLKINIRLKCYMPCIGIQYITATFTYSVTGFVY